MSQALPEVTPEALREAMPAAAAARVDTPAGYLRELDWRRGALPQRPVALGWL